MTFSDSNRPTDDRPERLVDAARELANETGSSGFTVTQVASRAGLSLKSFYRCFRGKDDLLIALLAEESAVGARLFEQAIRGPTNPLHAFVRQLFSLATRPDSVGYAVVLVREHRRLVEHRPAEIRAALSPLTDVIAARVTSADPQRDAQTVFGLLLDGLHDVVLGRVDDVPEFAEYLYDFCQNGLTRRGAFRVTATLLPDPEPRRRHYTIISVDDHLIEPADLFEDRMPTHLAERAPRVVTLDNGRETWVYEDRFYPQVGLNAVVGRPKDEWNMEPARFDEMRRGCYDIETRIADMDVDGIYASLCFPSLIAGFAGTVFSASEDPELGLASLRAWNDWHIEEWAAPHPDRVIPLQLAWLGDPELAATDIRANAARGCKAVSFPENPVDLKLPSLHTDHWDPILRACEETETVLCLHNGSSSWTAARSPGAPLALYTSLFPVNALVTAADWLWARIPTRFPRIKIAFSEGGISWVPMLIDRITYVLDHSAVGSDGWDDPDVSPIDALRRNFWFCAIDLGSTVALREHIGIDRICLESDYPHADSTWPDTQALAHASLAGLQADEVRKLTWQNASELFRHPVPEELQVP